MTTETRIINISGMTCDGCVKSVHNVTSTLQGVQSVAVDLNDNLATVTYDSDRIGIENIAEAIEDAGFDTSVANN